MIIIGIPHLPHYGDIGYIGHVLPEFDPCGVAVVRPKPGIPVCLNDGIHGAEPACIVVRNGITSVDIENDVGGIENHFHAVDIRRNVIKIGQLLCNLFRLARQQEVPAGDVIHRQQCGDVPAPVQLVLHSLEHLSEALVDRIGLLLLGGLFHFRQRNHEGYANGDHADGQH